MQKEELEFTDQDKLDLFLKDPGLINVRKHLKKLILRFGISNVPKEISNLINLVHLDLSFADIPVLPPEIGKLTKLQELLLRGTKLVILPPEIGQLINLQYLNLSRYSGTTLPSEIGQLVNLQHLDLSRYSGTTLPSEIGQLVNLQYLDLSRSGVTSLPPEIGQLVNLQRLNLMYSKTTSLPLEIGQLRNLQIPYSSDLDKTYTSSQVKTNAIYSFWEVGTPIKTVMKRRRPYEENKVQEVAAQYRIQKTENTMPLDIYLDTENKEAIEEAKGAIVNLFNDLGFKIS
ncbi:hypothetical protein BKI52_32980 [marine bacterium AO1-C]|nr:hypothetical protein BKI52_32980 [marine bacterium AO1-C]